MHPRPIDEQAGGEATSHAQGTSTRSQLTIEKQQMSGCGCFAGLVFSISGEQELPNKALGEAITLHGGALSGILHRRVSYLVCSALAVRRATQRVRKARKHGVPTVGAPFVFECAKQARLVAHEPFLITDAAARGGAGASSGGGGRGNCGNCGISNDDALSCARQLYEPGQASDHAAGVDAHSIGFRALVDAEMVAQNAPTDAAPVEGEPMGGVAWHHFLQLKHRTLVQCYLAEMRRRRGDGGDGGDGGAGGGAASGGGGAAGGHSERDDEWMAGHERRVARGHELRAEKRKRRGPRKDDASDGSSVPSGGSGARGGAGGRGGGEAAGAEEDDDDDEEDLPELPRTDTILAGGVITAEGFVIAYDNAGDDCYCVCHDDGGEQSHCTWCGGTREYAWVAPKAGEEEEEGGEGGGVGAAVAAADEAARAEGGSDSAGEAGEAGEVTYECEHSCGFEDEDFALVEAHEAVCAKKTCVELGSIKSPTKRKRKRLAVPVDGVERAVTAVVAPAPAGNRGTQKRKKRRQAGEADEMGVKN